ncbi:MAG: ABC transporter ATP-binding protein [Spirochaetaceae bacterium]
MMPILARLRPYLPRLFLGVVLSVLQAGILLTVPLLLGHAMEDGFGSDGANIEVIVRSAVLLVGVYMCYLGTALWGRHVTLTSVKRGVAELRSALLRSLLRSSRASVGRHDTSVLQTVLVHDTERVDRLGNAVVSKLLPSLLAVGGVTVVLAFLSPVLLAGLLVVMPAVVVVNRLLNRRMWRRIGAYHRSLEGYTRRLRRLFDTLDLARAHAGEEWELDAQRAEIAALRTNSHRVAWMASAFNLFMETLTGGSIIIVLIVGGVLLSAGSIGYAELLSFVVAAGILRNHLRQALTSVPEVREGIAGVRSLRSLVYSLDHPPYRGTRHVDFDGSVSLRRVSFSYAPVDDPESGRVGPPAPLFADIDLDLRPGKITLLQGPNGAGKTTLIYLILGFYRPSAGALYASGLPYDDIDLSILRSRTSLLFQDSPIFDGTVWENVRYGAVAPGNGRKPQDACIPDVELRSQIEEAAALAGLTPVLDSLPQGWETSVGEHGVRLSGGQRRRIALARAFARKPRLLLLDEPTTHLDTSAIDTLRSALPNLDPPPATLIVSHDSALTDLAHEVLTLDQTGRIAAAR